MRESYLTTKQAAEKAGVAVSTFRAYVTRGQAPAPDGQFGNQNYWLPETVDTWLASRIGQGARTDRARLVVRDRNNVTCPVCGAKATGYESSRKTREKVNRYEAWEGGPVLEVPTKQIVEEPDGPFITTVQPCGHEVDDVVFAE